jgi:2,3-bisphosphoglycerate-independent phosphoglycerate mutase
MIFFLVKIWILLVKFKNVLKRSQLFAKIYHMSSPKKLLLIILDGWGLGQSNFTNPIWQVGTPRLEKWCNNYPIGALQASGNAVGLEWQDLGGSEVGHMTMGAGKTIRQYAAKINADIRNGGFFKNPKLLETFKATLKNNGRLHIIGLLTSTPIHGDLDHLIATTKAAFENGIKISYLDIFLDGRDSGPKRGIVFLKELQDKIAPYGGIVNTISGRFFAMDRDQNWPRTKICYDNLTGLKIKTVKNWEEYLKENYERGINDEFIDPVSLDGEISTHFIENNDTLIFTNFREDRARQLFSSFALSNFNNFESKKLEGLRLLSMVKYHPDFTTPYLYDPDIVNNPLAQVISDNGRRQLHLAESEKYAAVTYFFNGLKETPYPSEHWIIVPSIKTGHLEESPALAINEMNERLSQAIDDNVYDFILVNYANSDLIAHTGNFQAGLEVVKIMDDKVDQIITKGLSNNYTVIITADHGNLEQMINPATGEVDTQHNLNPVPFWLIDPVYKLPTPRFTSESQKREKLAIGTLADIAPTVLDLMGIPKPPEMTGQSLLPILKRNN